MKTKLLILLLLSVGMFGSSLQAYDDTGVAGAKILQFIVIGDWGLPGSKGQKLVAAQMDRLAASTPIDFIASTGDNFYGRGVKSVDDPLWHRVFESVYSLPALKDVPWYLALGNHDYMGDTKAQIEYSENHSNWNLPDTYHSQVFKIDEQASLHMLFLDTNPFLKEYRRDPDLYPDIREQDRKVQLKWMKNALVESEHTWRIAIGHHPVYSSGVHGDTKALVKYFPRVFRKRKVHAYFSGHDHHLEHYRRTGSTHYFISGGGSRVRSVWGKERYSRFAKSSLGFALVKLDSSCMQLRFINEEGAELYQYRIPVDKETQCKQD